MEVDREAEKKSTPEIPTGFYEIELNKSAWLLPQKYKSISPIGSGAYGQVCCAKDTSVSDTSGDHENHVAIKKLTKPFQTSIHAKRTYRELKLLMHMQHENIIGLLSVFTPNTSSQTLTDVYMVTHLMGADLNNIIRTQTLSDDHIQFLTYQILRGLKYVHSAGIIHRDLKPSNIAVNEDCELRILDFGLARSAETEMTGYVATRWYRAPEIMLNWMHYQQTVDMWSVGCILGEMMTGKTLFPGTDHIDQLNRILKVCGSLSPDTMGKITSEEARNYMKSLPKIERKNFGEHFKGANPLAIDLLEKLLELDADLRLKAEDALSHPYLAPYSDPTDEPVSSQFDQTFEDFNLSVQEWKDLVWKEIGSFIQLQSQSST